MSGKRIGGSVLIFKPEDVRAKIFFWMALGFSVYLIINGDYYCVRDKEPAGRIREVIPSSSRFEIAVPLPFTSAALEGFVALGQKRSEIWRNGSKSGSSTRFGGTTSSRRRAQSTRSSATCAGRSRTTRRTWSTS